MGIVKTKLQNLLAIPMVETIIETRHGLSRHGQSCATFTPLPTMMEKFNTAMYETKKGGVSVPSQAQQEANQAEEEEEDMIQILNDVEELFGDSVFIIH